MIFQIFILGQFGNETQGDRLDCLAGITADRRIERSIIWIDIDFDQALDGIDRRHTVSTAANGCLSTIFDVRDVWRQFGNKRQFCALFNNSAVVFHQFRNLADIASGIVFRHVRAGEIEFQSIGTVLFHQLGQIGPFFIISSHDRNQKKLIRIVFLELFKDLEILA